MSQIIDTFSSNSLKVLDNSKDEFIKKYVYNLSFYKKDDKAIQGQKFHSLICSYIKGFDVYKMLMDLDDNEKKLFLNLEKKLKDIKKDFIQTEFSFNIKEKLKDKYYFLTGRFDAILKQNDSYIIYDWKTMNIPKDYQNDLQTVVYLYALNKIYKTTKIKMRYLSISKLEFKDVEFKDSELYKNIIDKIVMKIYN